MAKSASTTALKAALMALGAGAVLLFGGGFPLLGAPDIYRGGAMLLLAVLLAGLSLWGMLRIARGELFRLGLGSLFTFLSVIGLTMVLQYGSKSLAFAAQGGTLWFAAIGTACTASAGLIFIGVFGYLAYRLMTRRLWLAAAHLSVALVLVGALVDYAFEQKTMQVQPVDGKTVLSSLRHADGSEQELPFRLRADSFDILRYEGDESYRLYRFEHGTRQWVPLEAVAREGDELVLGEERWPLSAFTTGPHVSFPYLPAGKGRVILKDKEAPVREYRADCHITTRYKGREEEREEQLRVNEPILAKGWQITLMSHGCTHGGTPVLYLQLRHAPGRFWALSGMIGIILCTACWSWLPDYRKKKANNEGKEAAHA